MVLSLTEEGADAFEAVVASGCLRLFAMLTPAMTAMQTTRVAAITAMMIFVLFVIFIVFPPVGNNLKNGPSRKRPGPKKDAFIYAATLLEEASAEAGALLLEGASGL